MSNWEQSFEKKPARTMLKAGAALVAIFFALSLLGTALGVLSSPFTAAGGVIQKTLTPDNVLINYEWFKTQHQDVIAIGVKIDATTAAQKSFEQSAGERTSWKFDDRQEWSRLNSIILGLTGQRTGMIAEYNAKSEMINRSIFKTGDLPERL